jgi:integral membrane protein (TIGR03766 family)
MKDLFKLGNKTLDGLFNAFFFLTLFFAITSPNIILGDNNQTGAGTTLFTTGWLIVAVVVVVGLLTYRRFRRWAHRVFIEHRLRTATILLMAVVLWQIVFITNVHPPIGFDAGAIHEALTNTKGLEIVDYFSLNYNNVPILLVQHFFAELFNNKSWLFFDIITLIAVDLSALLNVLSVRILNRTKVAAALYIHAIWLAVFPMIIVSYSDTWVLPLVSGYFCFYCMMVQSRFNPWFRSLAAVGFAITAAGAYLIKPSAVVGVIAIVLVEILFQFKKRRQPTKKASWIVLAVAIGALGLSYGTLQHGVKNQTYIASYSTRHIPAIHFVSMGVSGEGGYNPKDALKMAKITTIKGRSEYSKKMLFKRLKQMGFWGYLKFLFAKQRNNTADGTFAWVKEGHFINENPIPKGGGFAGGLRQFVYLYGTRIGDFRFLAQVIWIIGLILIAFGWRDRRKVTQIMRLTILGGMLYLLIFEGGRSRYLIQFLPAYLILMTLVYDQTFNFFRRVYRWANGINQKGDEVEVQQNE